MAQAGFLEFEITWKKDVFSGAPQQTNAAAFGTQGVNYRARKPNRHYRKLASSEGCNGHATGAADFSQGEKSTLAGRALASLILRRLESSRPVEPDVGCRRVRAPEGGSSAIRVVRVESRLLADERIESVGRSPKRSVLEWWRRGRVELYREHKVRMLLAAA